MALTACKECRQQISSKATSCPHCGAPVKRSFGCGTLFVVAIVTVVVFAVIGAFSNSDRKVTESGQTEGVIYRVATRLVADRLKAPSTAKFPSFYDDGAATFTSFGNSRYKIKSYVDSKNGFGAQVRTQWTATVSVSARAC